MPRRRFEEEEIQASLLPVMNIMFLLIPALLQAMEYATMASINVAPPRFSATRTEVNPDDKPRDKPLNLKVFVMEDGFRVSADNQQDGAEPGKAVDSNLPTIPLARPGTPLNDFDRYDYAALEQKVRLYKDLYPNETMVTISAESKIPMQTMVTTMEALAGRDCRISKALRGEAVPDNCYFWQPIMEGGAG